MPLPEARIDAHQHFSAESLAEALVTMDRNHLEFAINARIVDPMPGLEIVRLSREVTGGRIVTLSSFEGDDLAHIEDTGRIDSIVDRFRREVDAGTKGLKVSKRLGMVAKYKDGSWVRPDDERLDPLWAAAGEMNVPVLIHIADPIPCWQPIDEDNRYYDELRRNPRRWMGDGEHLGRLELLTMRETILARHPDTVFVNAHWGCYPEDLDHLVRLFETYPNFYVDTERSKVTTVPLGVEHTSHRDILLKYADRTLFGTDLAYWAGRTKVDHEWNADMYDRQFSWFRNEVPGGMELPDDTLRKIFYDSAKSVYHL